MRCFNPNILTKHDDASDIGGLNDLLTVPSLPIGPYPQENAVEHPVECPVQRAVAELLSPCPSKAITHHAFNNSSLGNEVLMGRQHRLGFFPKSWLHAPQDGCIVPLEYGRLV